VARIVVQAAGRRLPGEHLPRRCRVGDEVQLLRELHGLTGLCQGSGVVADPRTGVAAHRQRRHEDLPRATLTGHAQSPFDDRQVVESRSEPPCGEHGVWQEPRIVPQRQFALEQVGGPPELPPARSQPAVQDVSHAADECREHLLPWICWRWSSSTARTPMVVLCECGHGVVGVVGHSSGGEHSGPPGVG